MSGGRSIRLGLTISAVVIAASGISGCVGTTEIRPATTLDAAHAIVLRTPFSSLLIQVDYQPGVSITKQALEDLQLVAERETLKDQITILPPGELASGIASREGGVWTLEEVEQVHAKSFKLDPDPLSLGNGTTAFLHILFLDSHLRYQYLNRTTDAGGVDVRNLIAVFSGDDAVRGIKPPMTASTPEGTGPGPVLIHEFGHAMGLLNLGAPMQQPHALPDDPYHSRNPESVMYGGVDTIGTTEHTTWSSTRHGDALFDADDHADLAALRAEES